MSFADYKRDDRPQRGAWAPGNYCCSCCTCDAKFIGDKRAHECADCAYDPTTRPPEYTAHVIDWLFWKLRVGLPIRRDPPSIISNCTAWGGLEMDFVKFLREAEHRTVQAAGNVNPCADASDAVQKALFARADEWKACAEYVEQLQSALRPFANYADTGGAIPDGMVITLGSKMAKRQLTMVDCRRAAATLK